MYQFIPLHFIEPTNLGNILPRQSEQVKGDAKENNSWKEMVEFYFFQVGNFAQK